jgi:hypothetical protein
LLGKSSRSASIQRALPGRVAPIVASVNGRLTLGRSKGPIGRIFKALDQDWDSTRIGIPSGKARSKPGLSRPRSKPEHLYVSLET